MIRNSTQGAPEGTAALPRTAAAALAVVLALGVAARPVAAWTKSLVLDEFHTWFHATRPGVSAFFSTLLQDNHPPLGFLTVALARLALGTSELALRAPALAFSVLEVGVLAWFGTRVGALAGARARGLGLAAAALLGASSMHLDYGSQARMYALHALAATVTLVAVHALLTRAQARAAAVTLAVSLTVAFHTHYFGGHYAVGALAAALGLAAFDPGVRARLRRGLLPCACAALASLPWAWFGFRQQLEHRLPPGGDDLGWRGLAEAFVHLGFHNVRLGGPTLRVAFIAAGGVALALGALGALRLLRRRETRVAGGLAAVAAFGVPVFAWALAHLTPRAGFTWHYILPSAAPLALLVAAGSVALGALSRALFGGVLALALTLTWLNATSAGTEDFRGAVRALLDQYEPGDAVIGVEWQPALFPQGQPYDYYAPRLSEAPPERLPMTGFTLADPSALDRTQRALVLRKSLPGDQHLIELLRARFEPVARQEFGFSLDVTVWQRR